MARQRKYPRSAHAVSPFGETRKCAYVDLKEKRVSALTVFFMRVKTLYFRFDSLRTCKRKFICTLNLEAAKTKIERFGT